MLSSYMDEAKCRIYKSIDNIYMHCSSGRGIVCENAHKPKPHVHTILQSEGRLFHQGLFASFREFFNPLHALHINHSIPKIVVLSEILHHSHICTHRSIFCQMSLVVVVVAQKLSCFVTEYIVDLGWKLAR